MCPTSASASSLGCLTGILNIPRLSTCSPSPHLTGFCHLPSLNDSVMLPIAQANLVSPLITLFLWNPIPNASAHPVHSAHSAYSINPGAGTLFTTSTSKQPALLYLASRWVFLLSPFFTYSLSCPYSNQSNPFKHFRACQSSCQNSSWFSQ